ncbi:MAG: bifunctional UDP-N-acetylglucosamine diphosphorylase/glucosamine-1-phosphate N-acetyltransferase GlmU [Rhodospirillaceae bacterium]|nr:bifunctional UDP-N-acetylglucosamine diphosphorylase/glucosamine-1-phosphate N-acetyltransferase GlmU [Rhodospirillaceae bacterium]
MTKIKTAAIVLAAGLGTRMKSGIPKVLHPLAGRPMIAHLLQTLSALKPDQIVVVGGGDGMADVAAAVAPHPCVDQGERLGTGHAVLAARPALGDFDGDVFVLFGGDPLIGADTLSRMIEARHSKPQPSIVVLGFETWEPAAYGRLITDGDGALEAIVEAKDATPEQLQITLCNSGVMLIDGRVLWGLLDRVGNENAKGEYYLTDIIALARGDGLTCAVVEGDEDELLGVDDRIDLASAEAYVQNQLRFAAMQGGATLLDPDSVHFSFDTRLGQDVTVGPHVVFGPGVSVGDGATIKAFSHLEGAHVSYGATVGPFVRLRPGADVGKGARVGNFVEIKNAVLGEGAKVNHLSYIGDADIGDGANIGAGTITCNYDGFMKYQTVIGKGAFIGSNTALVAPVTIGDGAVVGAGSTITKDVDADALALTRPEQKQAKGWAKNNREIKSAIKAKKTKT